MQRISESFDVVIPGSVVPVKSQLGVGGNSEFPIGGFLISFVVIGGSKSDSS